MGVVSGGVDLTALKFSAGNVKADRYLGAVLGGVGTGESYEEREAALGVIIGTLEPSLLRVVMGAMSPLETIELIEHGIDLIGTSYVGWSAGGVWVGLVWIECGWGVGCGWSVGGVWVWVECGWGVGGVWVECGWGGA